MTKAVNDIVIFLPGIMGSVLAQNGKTVWEPAAGAALRALFSGLDTIRNLKLDGDDPELDDLGDGVTATGLVQDLHIFPGLWKIDGYSGLRADLIRRLKLVPGETYFEFPYDWRRDNRVSARKLGRKARDWLNKRQKTHPDAQIILVAHSMGGIISRIFLDQLEGWRITRRLFTFGTPYSGALNSLDSLSNGFRIGKWGLEVDLSDILRSFTSVYQLLPSYRCIRTMTSDWLPIDDAAIELPNVDRTRMDDALLLHRGLRDAVDANRKLPEFAEHGYRVKPVVGNFVDTHFAAELRYGKVMMRDKLERRQDDGSIKIETGGDGTVPIISAQPHELLDQPEIPTWLNEKHGSLQNNSVATDNVASVVLNGEQTGGIFSDAEDKAVSVTTEDTIVGEPVTIFARAKVPEASMICTVEKIGSGTKDSLNMIARPGYPGEVSLTLDKPEEGDYRVTVKGEGTDTVTDLFSVIDIKG